MIDLSQFDVTDTTVGLVAAERANRLESILTDLLNCLNAKQQLANGFKGMGYNIMQETSGRLPSLIRSAKKVIGDG